MSSPLQQSFSPRRSKVSLPGIGIRRVPRENTKLLPVYPIDHEVGFFIRPLPRHSSHFAGKILRPGCVGCLTFCNPVPSQAGQIASVKTSRFSFITTNH